MNHLFAYLLHPLVDELPLSGHELLAVLSRLVEEAGVDLRLLVLQGNVAGQDVGIVETLGHVGVAGTVVHHNTYNKQMLTFN